MLSFQLKELLKEMTSLNGVSGHEAEVVKYVYQKAKTYTDDIAVDNTGNVTVHIPSPRPGAPKVVVFSHMDEIGMMVRMIEPDGFIRLERIGGINEQVMPGMRMMLKTEDGAEIKGVIGVRSHHITSPELKKKVPEIREMFLDIGAENREQALRWGVRPGNIVTFPADWVEYGNERVSCKSMDNRVSNVILLKLLHDFTAEQWNGPDVYLVFGVQEEFSVRGVLPAIRAIDPDICIGLDITVVYDTPDSKGLGEIKVGAGPAITYLHYNEGGTLAGLTYNEKLNAHFCRTAEDCGLPVQREVVIGVITETAFMSFEGTKGYICGNISIPTRYTHTPVELISLRDVDNAAAMLEEAVRTMHSVEMFQLVSQEELK